MRFVAADHVPRIVGHGDDEVEDYVLCEQVEEVVSVHVSLKALLNDAEERVQGAEIAHVLNHSPLLRMVDSKQFWTVRSLIYDTQMHTQPALVRSSTT